MAVATSSFALASPAIAEEQEAPPVVAETTAPSPAPGDQVPPSLGSLLREAHVNERATIVNVAKRLYPDATAEIDRLVRQVDDERRQQVTQADFVGGIRGEVSGGGYISSGNTDEWGVAAAVSLRRAGRTWIHNLELRADIKEENDERIEERLFANYALRRNFVGSDWYVSAGVRYERDPFQGFARRFGQFVGPGYQISNSPRLKWEVTAGPGLRQTAFIDAPDETQFGLFARTILTWDPTDRLQFREDLSAGVGRGNDTYASISSLTTNLYGDFYLRASFTVELETQPPPGREELETYTRLSLVYMFDPY